MTKKDNSNDFIHSEQVSPFVPHIALSSNMKINPRIDTVETVKTDEESLEEPKKPLIQLNPLQALSSIQEILDAEDLQELKENEEKFAEDEEDDDKNVLVIQIENWLCTGIKMILIFVNKNKNR